MFDSLLRLRYNRPFHFDAHNERPPMGAQDGIYKDPIDALRCHVLGTRAAAFLFLDGSAVFVLRARGSRDIPSTFGFREGMDGSLRLGSGRL